MYAVSQQFLDAIRTGGGARYGYVEAWYQGSIITLDDGSTRLPLRADGTNEVAVDASTPGARSTLTVTLARQPGLWDKLAPVGTELKAYTVIRYPSGDTETVPQGVFVVDVQTMGYTSSGDLKITAPDRWVKIARAKFLAPRASTPANTLRQSIASLITEVVGGTVTDTGTTTATVGAKVWDDRAQAIEDMAKAGSLDVSFDRNGNPVIRDMPTLQSTAVWTVDAGENGVLVAADRQRDRQRTFNMVVVQDTRNDGSTPLAPIVVWDNNPNSPTYAGPGGPGGLGSVPPANQAGPFGQVPTTLSGPYFTSAAQMTSAGQTLLAKVSGLNAQVNATSVPNVALAGLDTIELVFPHERHDLAPARERHIIDQMTVPLIWHKNPLTLTTRSTVADIPGA